jgi:glycosyltransferase involved in cell wall biosynthesis
MKEIYRLLKKHGLKNIHDKIMKLLQAYKEIKLDLNRECFTENRIEVSKKIYHEKKLTTSMSPLVSIIIPCFNQEHFLEYTIQSIANATEFCHEVIIVDDHIESRTGLFKLEKIKAQFPHQIIKIIRLKANYGLSEARNIGVSNATAPFVKFLDADDLLSPDSLDREIEALTHNQSALTVSSYVIYFQNSGICILKSPFESSMTPNKIDAFPNPSTICSLWERGLTIPIHSVLMRKKIIPKFDITLRNKEDFNFWLKIANLNPSFTYLEKPSAIYRRHETQTTNDTSIKPGFYFIESIFQAAKTVELDTLSLKSAISYAISFYGKGAPLLFSNISKDRKMWLRSIVSK